LDHAPTFDDIVRLAEQGDSKAVKAVSEMAHYLGAGIALLVVGLAPDVIVVVGEVTRLWSQIGPIITQSVKERCFTHAEARIVPTNPLAQPRLQGTIALVLQKHFGAPMVA
jgi:predicted NBD/HSP70 family sugar kinase